MLSLCVVSIILAGIPSVGIMKLIKNIHLMPWNCHQQKIEDVMAYPWVWLKILFRFNWEFLFQVQQLIPNVGNWQIPWNPGIAARLDPKKLGWELHPEALAGCKNKTWGKWTTFLGERSFRFLRINSLGLSFLELSSLESSFLEFHPFQELFPGIFWIFLAHFVSQEQRVMDGCCGHCNCKLQLGEIPN